MTAYNTTFFSGHLAGSLSSARAVVPLLRSLFTFNSVVDIGCGTGAWLSIFAESGTTDYLGLDGPWVDASTLAIPRDRFMAADLANPLPINRRFDLALSVEVAEHLPEIAADAFITSLTRLAPVVLFSAAMPGQGGTDHINEQWPDYWAAKFETHGYAWADCLRLKLWSRKDVQWWYAQNMLLYVDRKKSSDHPALAPFISAPGESPHRLVHPKCFELVAQRPLGVSRIVREGPGAVGRAVRSRLGLNP